MHAQDVPPVVEARVGDISIVFLCRVSLFVQPFVSIFLFVILFLFWWCPFSKIEFFDLGLSLTFFCFIWLW